MKSPELATLDKNSWKLESGVIRHKLNPQSFWIPDESIRNNVDKGAAVKLLFIIESEDNNGEIYQECERMWVIVLNSNKNFYFGVLDSDVDCVKSEIGALRRGSKLCFKPEHIIDIDYPPKEYLEENYPDEFAI
ncbi:hypothetical protein ACLKMH_12125 [Psychromonas sp. KJ10-10]|uniref:hypothetical protein n=1 Tax=Psychromonas sp. KJ10-10 TaxID=3391823 RepID=UPI0039B3AA04